MLALIEPIVITIAALTFFVGVTAFSVSKLLRKGARDAEAKLANLLGGEAVLLREPAANSFGLASRGVTQLRGNGALVLTPERVAFQPWFRDEPVVIARRDIATVKKVRSHLGKTIGRDLLAIEWKSGDQQDTIALFVRELDAWIAKLARG